MLLEAGANINERNERGNTPLHWAAMNNPNPAIIIALLEAGANPNTPNKSGETPWDDIQDNEDLKDTEAYWRLHDARFD